MEAEQSVLGACMLSKDALYDVLEKVREIRAIVDKLGLDIDIQIDGGINEETAILAREAGANILVSGNTIFKAENRAEMIAKLKK
jgi:ribulose-phosphate 3-epimerase